MATPELIEILKQEIYNLAKKEAEEILKEAKINASKIIEEAKQKASEILKSRLEKSLRDIRRTMNSKMMSLRSEKKAELIRVREEYIDKVFNRVYKHLQEFTVNHRNEYSQVLSNLVIESLKEIGEYGDEFVILVNSRDEELLRNILPSLVNVAAKTLGRKITLTIHKSPVEFIGGVIVSTRDGRIYYNNTFEARIQHVKEKYLEKIYDLLFEGRES